MVYTAEYTRNTTFMYLQADKKRVKEGTPCMASNRPLAPQTSQHTELIVKSDEYCELNLITGHTDLILSNIRKQSNSIGYKLTSADQYSQCPVKLGEKYTD